MLRKLCVLSCLFFAFALAAFAQDSRHFTFHYAFTVRNLPAGKKVRIWIPAAQSDALSRSENHFRQGDLPLEEDTRIEIRQSDLLRREQPPHSPNCTSMLNMTSYVMNAWRSSPHPRI